MAAGKTSIDGEKFPHDHHYNVDGFGNGVTSRYANPDGSGSHVHQIRDGVVQGAVSEEVDPKTGDFLFEGWHDHTPLDLVKSEQNGFVNATANNNGREPDVT